MLIKKIITSLSSTRPLHSSTYASLQPSKHDYPSIRPCTCHFIEQARLWAEQRRWPRPSKPPLCCCLRTLRYHLPPTRRRAVSAPRQRHRVRCVRHWRGKWRLICVILISISPLHLTIPPASSTQKFISASDAVAVPSGGTDLPEVLVGASTHDARPQERGVEEDGAKDDLRHQKDALGMGGAGGELTVNGGFWGGCAWGSNLPGGSFCGTCGDSACANGICHNLGCRDCRADSDCPSGKMCDAVSALYVSVTLHSLPVSCFILCAESSSSELSFFCSAHIHKRDASTNSPTAAFVTKIGYARVDIAATSGPVRLAYQTVIVQLTNSATAIT